MSHRGDANDDAPIESVCQAQEDEHGVMGKRERQGLRHRLSPSREAMGRHREKVMGNRRRHRNAAAQTAALMGPESG